ncbi:UNVERIFIED_CONTAM: hypothetical protein Scaly_2927200 [Sesamum calycinum]|uniref:Uncharacterized protein n=1 Tax=Sesamum calycinum TaxID=2727403 RepID=A0AAW2K858_9LAMI
MSPEYMFLTMVIPSHLNPKHLIDVYLELLIEELQNLWHVGVLTRDSAKDDTFTMRATLMWTVDDLPAYGIAFGWSFGSVMGCPVYMKLIPIAFCEMLPESVWSTLTKVSLLFQILCSTTLDVNKVKNKAHVDASIVEAYIVKEIGLFISHYFELQVLCKRNMPSRNNDLAMNGTRIEQFIFNYPGRASGASKKR